MCGCGRGGGGGATSGAWYSTSAASAPAAQPDGPWEVQRPRYTVGTDGMRVRDGWETVLVDTYAEADSLVRSADPVSGRAVGGGIRPRRDLPLTGAARAG